MPRGDGTGPMGLGPMTGRGAGFCAGYPVPGFMNPMAGRWAAPAYGYGMAPAYGYGAFGYGRPRPMGGWGRGGGFGRGIGRGFGRGFGRGLGFGRGRGRGWRAAGMGYGYGW